MPKQQENGLEKEHEDRFKNLVAGLNNLMDQIRKYQRKAGYTMNGKNISLYIDQSDPVMQIVASHEIKRMS